MALLLQGRKPPVQRLNGGGCTRKTLQVGVPGPDAARDSKAKANIQRIACDIVALNVFTLKALQDGWYQSPQVVNRSRYEELQESLTAEEQGHVDMIAELSDRGFDAHVAAYVASLSHADQLGRIMDPRPSTHYADLLMICTMRYRAAVAHAATATKVEKLDIPEQYDFCETYQAYVEQTVVRELETRRQTAAALRRAWSLRDSIRVAMDDGSLSDACLAVLKTKLAALQDFYPEAHVAAFETSRSLFDPNAERWWEPEQAAPTVTEQAVTPARPPPTAVTAYPARTTGMRPTLAFVVPIVCLLCCIPTGYACSYSPPGPGTTTDSDFWQLVAGSAMQALSLATLLWPGASAAAQGNKVLLPRLSGVYTWLLAATSAGSLPMSIVLYLLVSARWSVAASFAGNAAQALILLQLVNGL
ncbi:key lime pathogenicity protein [Purpureocillium lavendulum]|uniref:Key lime pathogenicity protein n=1 Tax=Purpureocillium lavendulum TaxID=1247861 RepID=A0AB34FNV2_9HYPO|nr:key lime pathogenicity protein [Purpureocillium lavendulum]